MKKYILVAILIIMTFSNVYATPPTWPFALPANPNGYPYTTVFQDIGGGEGNELRVHYTDFPYMEQSGSGLNNEESDWVTTNSEGQTVNYTKQTWYNTPTEGWDAITNNSTGQQILSNAQIIYCNYDVLDMNGNLIVGNMERSDSISITLPVQGYTDVIKTISYRVAYKTTDADYSKYTITVKGTNLSSISSGSDIASYELVSNNFSTVPDAEGYYNGTMQFVITYKTEGDKEVYVDIKNNETGAYHIDSVGITIKSFVDTDGDGRDDQTGLDLYTPPSADDNGSWDGSIGGSVNILTGAWSDMRAGVLVISSMIGGVFGWLPSEVQWLIFAVISILLITTILKIIRG